MATLRMAILNSFTKPDSNGNTYFEPESINFSPTNKRYDHMLLAFISQSAKQGISGKFTVPKNYVGSAKIIIDWASTATTGDCGWAIAYTAVASGETLDPSTDQEAPSTVTQTTSGTARFRNNTSITLTSANLAVDDEVLFNFYRDGAAAGDTLASTAYLFNLQFEYADV